jgi:hypothetical protein
MNEPYHLFSDTLLLCNKQGTASMKQLSFAVLLLIFSEFAGANVKSLSSFLSGTISEDKLFELSDHEVKHLQAEIQQYTLDSVRAKRLRYKSFADNEISLSEVCLPDNNLYELGASLTLLAASDSNFDFTKKFSRITNSISELVKDIDDLPKQNTDVDIEEKKEIFHLMAERDQQIILGLPSKSYELAKSLSKDEQEAFFVLVNKYICQETYHHGNYALQLINKFGWPNPSVFGEGAGLSVWLIFQHLDSNPILQRQFLPKLHDAVEKGFAKAKWYAFLYDRVKINGGEKQLYGTQLNGCGLKPLSDPENVDRRRSKLGMESVESYLSWVPNCAGGAPKQALLDAGVIFQ